MPKHKLTPAEQRKGGKAGGPARSQKLTVEQRKSIAALGGRGKGKSYKVRQVNSLKGKRSLVTMTKEERSARARKAAAARWAKRRSGE